MKDLIIDASLNLTVVNSQTFGNGFESYNTSLLNGNITLDGTISFNGSIDHNGGIELDATTIKNTGSLDVLSTMVVDGESFFNNTVIINSDLYVLDGSLFIIEGSESGRLSTTSLSILMDESLGTIGITGNIEQYDNLDISGTLNQYGQSYLYGYTEIFGMLKVNEAIMVQDFIYTPTTQLKITSEEIRLNYASVGGVDPTIQGIRISRPTIGTDQMFVWDESIDKFQQRLQDLSFVNIQQQDPIEDEDVVTYGFLQSYTTGGISGTGTLNYISKFQSQNEIQDSIIYELTGKIGINTITPSEQLEVNGNILADSYKSGNYSIEHEPLDDVLDILYSGTIKSYIDQDGQYNGSVILSAGLIVDTTQGRLKIPTSQPQSPELGDIWIE